MLYFLVPIVLAAGFYAYVSTKPNTMRVHREVLIRSTPSEIFSMIEDFHRWAIWSPWDARDPQMKRTYSGPERGPSAVYEWNGNNKVGQGRMEILSTIPDSHVVIKLDFIKPFEGHNQADFILTPQSDGTLVSWTMTGEANFVSKAMGTFIDMDKMIGSDFEIGLANLKRELEH